MVNSNAGDRLRKAAGVTLSWRIWDEEVVVFDHGSGDTHLLDSSTAAVLHLFESAQDAIDTNQVLSCLADLYEVESATDLTRFGQEIISNLEHLGLIETLSP